jgi:uncharacterized membrane protein HdeD (DUF308 family)
MAAGDRPPTVVPWWAIAACGVLSVLAGVLAIAFPEITLLALALIAGINLLALGALAIGEALGDEDADGKTLRIVLGVVAVLAGIVVLRRPGDAVLVLVVALGAWLVLSGIVELVRALLRGTDRRVLTALGGAIDVAVGIVVLALPHVSLRTLATLAGCAFAAHGVVLIVRAAGSRRARAPRRERPAPGVPAPRETPGAAR